MLFGKSIVSQLFLEMDDWRLGVKKIVLLLGKSKNGMILLNWYKKYFWDIGKEEKSVSQLFLENLVTEKSVSQIVKLGVVFGTFYCGIYVG